MHWYGLFISHELRLLNQSLCRPLGWEGVDLAGGVTEGSHGGATQDYGMGPSLVMGVCAAQRTLFHLLIVE